MTVMLPVGTRTHVPRLPTPWLRRPRLNRRISDLRAGDVMLVAAFAGSGKTMFLADWFTNDRLCDGAWLTVDARDNEPGRFARLIAHALGLDGVAGEQRRSRRGDALVIDRVFENLEGRGGAQVLVLDDVHELTERESLAALEHLLHNASPGLTVVVSTRADPPLPLGRLIVEGRLQQIRADELALTPAEADAVFDAHGLSLTREHVASLHARTGGWAAGVRLAALALAEERDPARFVADTVQSDAVMSEYLMQEVLARLPEDLQHFLLRTSVAQPLTVELATILSGDVDAGAKLAQLERAGLFVTRADRPVDEYRFHALFGALLHAQLRHAEPALERALSEQAAEWFDRHDMPVEAELHAFAAGDWSRASSLACRRWVQGALGGSVGGVTIALPPGAPRADVAELSLVAAIDATVDGDRPNATLWRTRLDALLEPEPGAGDAVTYVARLLLDVLYARAFGIDARGLAACRALRDAELGSDADTALLHAVARLREAEILLETDDDEATLRAILDARLRGSRNAAPWIVAECDALIGLIAAVRGRLDVCDTLFAQSADTDGAGALAGNAPDAPDTRRLARVLCEAQRGRLQSARALLLAEVPASSAPHAVRLGLEEAAHRLDLTTERQRRASAPASTFGTYVRIALGAIDEVSRGSAERQVAAARALFARTRSTQIVELLRHFEQGREAHSHLRTRIEALTLLSIAADRTDDSVLALSAIRRALALAEPADLRAPFLAYPVPLGEVIDRYSWQLAGDNRYAVLLVDDLRREEMPAFLEPLTDRERAVLDYLPTMMSNAEIAQQLLVSVNTVKTHLKAVYRKLGVVRRRDAVVRARQLELL